MVWIVCFFYLRYEKWQILSPILYLKDLNIAVT